MSGRELAIEKMRTEGLPEVAVETFARQYDRLAAGDRGTIAEAEIEPLAELPDANGLPDAPDAPLDEVAVIKLNGGLGTSMGMGGPKSLLPVKDGRTFLDLVAEQVLDLRARSGARLPLVLMNSFSTRERSLAHLAAAHPAIAADVPADFLQTMVPKLLAADLTPARCERDRALEWVPPGHGDIYPALAGSGMLAALLDAGYRFAFVSNSDNLGATVDARILGWMAREGHPFVIEATDRARSDRKGGHLARRRSDGALILREIAQTPEGDHDAFQDTTRHRYFNTNNIWLDLRELRRTLDRERVIDLPMIVNRKTLDPQDPDSPAVIQLETAMGAAVAAFPGAAALRVDRRRYAPVKTTADLLALRSDAYVIGEGRVVTLAPERGGVPPLVELDPDHQRLVADFERAFPAGAPSLIACDRLVVRGDVTFGAGVVVRGDVVVEGVERVPDGALLG